MKLILKVFMFFSIVCNGNAQQNSDYQIIASNLGSSGSSKTVINTNGTYKVSQSIGQASVIGTHKTNSYFLRQGYQQPSIKLNNSKKVSYTLSANVYPNPFNHQIAIAFSTPIKENVTVLLFDVTGKQVYLNSFLPAQVIDVQLNRIQSGTYFLKVVSDEKSFNTKLIKI